MGLHENESRRDLPYEEHPLVRKGQQIVEAGPSVSLGRDVRSLFREMVAGRKPKNIPRFDAIRLRDASRQGFLVGSVVLLLFFMNDLLENMWDREPNSYLFYCQTFALTTMLVATWRVWSRNDQEIWSLRIWAFFVLFAVVVFNSAYQLSELQRYRQIIVGITRWDMDLSETIADSFSLRWGLVILLFILFVPHASQQSKDSFLPTQLDNVRGTLVRSGLIALAIGVVPLVIMGVFCMMQGVPGRAWNLMVEMLVWIGLATAAALYAQYRFEVAYRGEQVGGAWIIEGMLGHPSGFADVFLARHRGTGQQVVLKFPKKLPDWMYYEAVTMGKLSHPNLAQIYYYDKGYNDLPYIVMERIVGKTLHELMDPYVLAKETTGLLMEPGRVVYILRQICNAIGVVHRLNILHLDIKPSNIMITNFFGYHDFVKVIDFGISRDSFLTSSGANPGSGGTPGYMSPEQYAGEALDGRSDIYSIGVLGHYLLTGDTLENASGGPLWLLQQRNCPEDLYALIKQCVEPNRNERFADTLALIRALNQLQSAGEWSEERASAWWKSHGYTADSSAKSDATTLVIPT